MAAPGQISVILLGHPDPDIAAALRLPEPLPTEADEFGALAAPDDRDLARLLVERRPHAIFSFGALGAYPNLHAAPLEVRRRWVHFPSPPPPPELARRVLDVFVDVATNDRLAEHPLVSVFTPTYRTGETVFRPLESLLRQTYTNWEWVVYDDSPDDETFQLLRSIEGREPRVQVFRGGGNCGRIGEVKRRLCGLARGAVLVELDHDDELTDHCLADLVEAFTRFPEAGFAYSDCAESFEDGEPAAYPAGWGFGFGSYREETYRGRPYLVTNYPPVNAKTIRHIVGVPNHVRAWRRAAYLEAGGYAGEIPVADDYELLVRTFLTTRMVHVARFGYIQHLRRDQGNTQRQRNRDIQLITRLVQERYGQAIHKRLLELGLDDFVWLGGQLDWTATPGDRPINANLVLQ